ncbi:dermonecrotic toxin domain-containing protein [Pseudomonas sp. L1(2025)]|uniref:dermonecrotic toxin domain-containing protein n=1 Tax=Pseudomonas sp. L1(2025) TaxID=3449429 RepID=UPI003F68F677
MTTSWPIPTFPFKPKPGVARLNQQPQDTSLLLTATQRWQECRTQLRELMSGIPDAPSLVTLLIKERLALDGNSTGLRCLDAEGRSGAFISLSNAAAFVRQHSPWTLPPEQKCITVGLPEDRPYQAVLQQLAELDLDAFLEQHWNRYWESRAPGTPVSRRSRIGQLYNIHLEASAQVAFAERSLSATQLQALLAVNGHTPTPKPGEPQLYSEQLALCWPHQRKEDLPGALVFTIDDEPLTAQLLYLPSEQPPLKRFAERTEMEQWLVEHQQQLLPHVANPAAFSVDYNLQLTPRQAAVEQLLAHWRLIWLDSVRTKNGGNQLSLHGVQALSLAQATTTKLRQAPVFANLPVPTAPGPDEGQDEPGWFGLLQADIPLDTRWSNLKRERDALEGFLGNQLPDTVIESRLQTLKTYHDTLTRQEQLSISAATALLYRERVFDTATINLNYTALHTARVTALRIEADLLIALDQLSAEEHRWITSTLSQPAPAPPSVAQLSLSASTRNGDALTVTSTTLKGPLVFADAATLNDPLSPHSLLLYCPGSHGTLQRFASRRELEQHLFRLQDDAPDVSLKLEPLSGDAMEHSLEGQHGEFESLAADLRQRYPIPEQAGQLADELQQLRIHTLTRLTVPVNAVRQLAYAQILEQRRSGALVKQLPTWFKQMPDTERTSLKALMLAYLQAAKRSHALLERDLPPREVFCKKLLGERLHKDFAITRDWTITLDIPDAIVWRRDIVAGAAPGTPQTSVPTASKERSSFSLSELLLLNIDTNVEQRLSFRHVTVICDDKSQAEALRTGLTLPYLRTLARELDLAQRYEDQIRLTFMGSTAHSTFINEYQRECLVEPLRQLLKLESQCGVLENRLTGIAPQVLAIAIDARTPEAWNRDGMQVALIPAYLTAGGKDTNDQGTTLAGVTFIEEKVSGLTLLYLPDSPDGQRLYTFSDLEQARRKLFNLCLDDTQLNYLAGRALLGDPAAHASRLKQAHLKNFHGMIGTGLAWPATTSLADHLLNTHMGRLIEANRSSARSNMALAQERHALKSGMVFSYLKMVLGLVPFVGTGIALYDAWTSANLATAAFLRGEVGHGLAEMESVLLALFDAALDLATGVSVTPTRATATRQRQLQALVKHPSSLHHASLPQARRVIERFSGYEYEASISLHGLQPQAYGIYRNVYRHAQGNFIVRQGRVYQVELHGEPQGWRLSPTRSKTYKQPIALNEAGEWDTHYAVYGTLFNGGLAGGGNVLGHVAEAFDPLWPQAVRDWLPRWWTDRRYREQRAVLGRTRQRVTAFEQSEQRVNQLVEQFEGGDTSVEAVLETALTEGIETARQLSQHIDQLNVFSRGNQASVNRGANGEAAYSMCWNAQRLVKIRAERMTVNDDLIDDLLDRLDVIPDAQTQPREALSEQIRTLRQTNLGLIDQVQNATDTMNASLGKVTDSDLRQNLATAAEVINRHLSAKNLDEMKVNTLLELVVHHTEPNDVSWHYLQGPLMDSKNNVSRAVYLQANLHEVRPTATERNTLLTYCVSAYRTMERNLNRWAITDSRHFNSAHLTALASELKKMRERAQRAIREVRPQPDAAPVSTRRVFQTVDNMLLIGVENWDRAANLRRYTLTGAGGRTEIWEQGADGLIRLTNPAPLPAVAAATNIHALNAEALTRLEGVAALIDRVEGYARQHMLPVELEEMLQREADALRSRALAIEALAPQNPIILRLRNQAVELIDTGRSLRTRQSLRSPAPTDGMLDDLVQHNVVEIRRNTGLKDLGRRPDRQRDFMQEYEVWDLTATPPQVLWYVHFHYNRRAAPFDAFEKAHLKLPEHRFLTRTQAPELPHSDISQQSAALAHIRPHWVAAE